MPTHDHDPATVRSVLEDNGVSADRASVVSKVYKTALQGMEGNAFAQAQIRKLDPSDAEKIAAILEDAGMDESGLRDVALEPTCTGIVNGVEACMDQIYGDNSE